MLQRIVVSAAIVVIGGVLGANVYNSVVDVPNWGASIPGSLASARQYFGAANPGTFFRVASPLAQGLALAVLLACWSRGGGLRWPAAMALVLVVLGDVLTFGYFYPRNSIMMSGPMTDRVLLSATVHSWAAMNHVRSAIILAALVCELTVLGRIGTAAELAR
jgi:hypothetical protein